ncbi:MAG: SCO family protein [Candidatus Sedimenticola sp. PURPLELP]
MNRTTRRTGLLLFIFLILQPNILLAAEGFKVIASIKPVHSILSGLMAGTRGAQLLVGKGQSPYGYKLTSSQQADLSEADLVIWTGPELETFLTPAIKGVAPKTRVVTLLDNPRLKILQSRHDENRRDPFFWLDSRNAIITLNILSEALKDADPGRAHLYTRNYKRMLAKISDLDRKLEFGYRGLKTGIGVNYFDTLQYFEQAYALKIRTTLAESPLAGQDTGLLLSTRAQIKDGYFSCLLTERGAEESNLALLTSGVDINQGELDSFGVMQEPGESLYFRLMQYNTKTIKDCLQAGETDREKHQEPTPGPEDDAPIEIGGKFMLSDHNGQLVTEKDLLGKYQMIYFGYTFCPDICPTSLSTSSMALSIIGEKADLIQPYFITIDPERDTADVMKRYVEYFNEKLIGLTGSRAMIDRVAQQFKARYEKVLEEGTDPDLYAMDHSASVYLMAPDGKFITKFAHGISPESMAELLLENLPK